MKRKSRMTRAEKRKKFKTVANWLRAKEAKNRKEKAERWNKEFNDG